jgi:hypothetical protein
MDDSQRNVVQKRKQRPTDSPTKRVDPSKRYDKLAFWDDIFTREVIAAVAGRTIDSLGGWRYANVPADAKLLLMLYSGELSMADWENQVEDTAKKLRDEWRRKRSQKAREANDRLESMCGEKK